MNVLLHICCAPCAIFPVEEIKKSGDQLAGFFYNPNIHPYSEYMKRKEAVEKYAAECGINVIFPDYDVAKYFQGIAYDEGAESRCPACWWLRMEKAAAFAKENGFDAFTTTLLGSPYQDHDILKRICQDIADRVGLKFYYKDFRTGFGKAHDLAKSKGIYCQNYCGCIFSEVERAEEKKRKKTDKKQGKA